MTDATQPAAQTTTLSAAQLDLLVRHGGVRGELCGLPPAGPVPASAEDLLVLQRAGMLEQSGEPTPSWKPLVAALMAPDLRLLATTGSPAGVAHLQAFGGAPLDGKFVSCGERGEAERLLAWPLEVDDVLALFAVSLGLDGRTPDPGLRLELTADGFLALAAVLDALREAELNAMLAHNGPPAPTASLAAIRLALDAGMISDDARWLVPVFRRMLPTAPDSSPAALERGLADLAGAAIVQNGGDARSWTLVPAFEPAWLRLKAPLAWGTLAAIGLSGGKTAGEWAARWNQLGALRTLGGLWGFESSGGRVRFVTVEEPKLLESFRLLIEAARAQEAKPAASEAPSAPAPATAKFCASCGTPLRLGWKFCGACGAPLVGAAA